MTNELSEPNEPKLRSKALITDCPLNKLLGATTIQLVGDQLDADGLYHAVIDISNGRVTLTITRATITIQATPRTMKLPLATK